MATHPKAEADSRDVHTYTETVRVPCPGSSSPRVSESGRTRAMASERPVACGQIQIVDVRVHLIEVFASSRREGGNTRQFLERREQNELFDLHRFLCERREVDRNRFVIGRV